MQNDNAIRTTAISARDAVRQRNETTGLQRHPRFREDLIRLILIGCASVSILTTFAIILVLGTESSRFFTRVGFSDSNKYTTAALDETADLLEVTDVGSTLNVGRILRIGEEEVLITTEESATRFRIQRAYGGTRPERHPVNAAIALGEPVDLGDYLTGTRWQPEIGQFGILPLVNATFLTSLIAMLIAGPVGLGVAIFLSEYASERVRAVVKPILELLAGIPTVVYGYFALTFVTMILRSLLNRGDIEIIGQYNMLSAGLVMGIMIIPTISSISEDALSAVPRSLREASYGLGATKFETVVKVLLPAALSGILAAFILGIARAVGETMIVAVAAGAGPVRNLTLNPVESGETMTGHIARISTGDLSFGSIQYNSIFVIGLTLFLITLGLNLASNYIRNRFREVYS
ncbi:MAG: phosphate ABC transporter permease subunit PstC [Anaerolineales bacterium]|nr:phosphate ABC transporter permease subunit PstC [Anaerolineales bacterium]